MLTLATILDNPGEPSAHTQYRDPAVLRELGYNGVVLYETTSLSGVDHPDLLGPGEMRRWLRQKFDAITEQVDRLHAAGLAVFLAYDVLALARVLVEENSEPYVCRSRQRSLCPASEPALERSAQALRSLLGHWPAAQGVVLRFGDSDAARLPYLVGNDIYAPHCPRCSHLGRAERILQVLGRFHRLVVEDLGKTLIARAWNVRPGGLHDTVELARQVAPRLPGAEDDPRFILSFKFTQTDFWRYQQWNPASLVFDRRPILYEVECQREYEGKGGIPNWQVPLWSQGGPETASPAVTLAAPAGTPVPGPIAAPAGAPGAMGKASALPVPSSHARASDGACPWHPHGSAVLGLATASQKVNLAGLWAWVRGGGWGGPFVENEAWIDANAFAVPILARHPQTPPEELAQRWVHQRLRVDEPDVAGALVRILQHSAQTILEGFYIGPFARSRPSPWHPNADWIQDDLLDAQAAWRIIQRLSEKDLDEVVREKQAAVQRLAEDRSALQRLVQDHNAKTLEPLLHTLIYAESFFQTLRDLLGGLSAYRRWQKTRSPDHADAARRSLLAAQSHWNHHTQRHAALPGAATAFREAHFWDLTERILTEIQKA